MENKRPTYKSTAFILIVVSQLITLVSAIAQYIPPQTAAILTAFLTAVFTGFNAWIKVNSAPFDLSGPEGK